MGVREKLGLLDEKFTLFDNFDDAVIGIGRRVGQPPLIVYDRNKCLDILVKGGMAYDEAEEFFEFNTAGAWVGEQTPIIVESIDDIEDPAAVPEVRGVDDRDWESDPF